MRKIILTLVAALAVAFASSPASAGYKYNHNKKAVVAGAVVGTVIGISLYNGSSWLGNSSLATLGVNSTGGAIAGGLIAGIATTALIHAATTPCTGFHAILGGSGCKNGQYVYAKRYHRRNHGLLWWLD
ncbi:MAG: hypothetical protein KF826_12810 [Xanthobacteraceae bacterium]|nr:hypothetical protein [Xanthobacteraceae bacterium]MBX3535223.1 hypothetical protein [Xanthobacteraceae bacterium]MBX3550361.1 hypothetical protein [Xanthobacteraceae bacterium]MCW5673488.1 hypothetical protein [Xanthobacteraceae bacterium]MCW5679008.1 hypothetical protein [Xanthobacteraceae bacterium]